MTNKNIEFVLPNLQLSPKVQKIFSRASLQKTAPSFEKTIKTLFQGIGNGAFHEGVFGAYAAGLVVDPTKQTWCQVSFLECEVDHQTVYAHDASHVVLSLHEIEQLKATFLPFFAEVDLSLHITPAGEWYLGVHKHTDVVMNDVAAIAGKNLTPFLPSGPDQGFWRRLITECQMLLSTHPVNIRRRENRQAELTCLWFEGLGKAHGPVTTSFKHVCTDESSLQGLAKWAGVSYSSLENGFNNLSAQDFPAVVIARNLKNSELFEKQWLEPAYVALNQGKLESIILDTACGLQFCLKRRYRYYFWRRTKI